MEKRAEIIIYGRVQKAGFRDSIDEIAFNPDLSGFVKNIDDGTLEKINIRQYPIHVEKIDVEYKKPVNEFTIFEILREENLTTATYERMNAAVRYMREMNSNPGQKIDGLGLAEIKAKIATIQ